MIGDIPDRKAAVSDLGRPPAKSGFARAQAGVAARAFSAALSGLGPVSADPARREDPAVPGAAADDRDEALPKDESAAPVESGQRHAIAAAKPPAASIANPKASASGFLADGAAPAAAPTVALTVLGGGQVLPAPPDSAQNAVPGPEVAVPLPVSGTQAPVRAPAVSVDDQAPPVRSDRPEQFQQKWEPALPPELRKNKEMERFNDPVSTGNALAESLPGADDADLPAGAAALAGVLAILGGDDAPSAQPDRAGTDAPVPDAVAQVLLTGTVKSATAAAISQTGKTLRQEQDPLQDDALLDWTMAAAGSSEANARIPVPAGETVPPSAGRDMPDADTAEPQRYRFTRATGEGGHLDLSIGIGRAERVVAETGPASRRVDENVMVVEARRFLAPAPVSNATALTAGLAQDPGWQAAMLPGAASLAADTGGLVVNTLKLQMKPVELGSVTALLRLKGDALNVHLTVETRAAYRQLSDDSSGILEALRAQGFAIDQVTVSMAVTGGSDIGNGQPGQADQAGGQQGGAAQSGQREGAGSGREQAPPPSYGQGKGRHEEDVNETISDTAPAGAGGLRSGHLYL